MKLQTITFLFFSCLTIGVYNSSSFLFKFLIVLLLYSILCSLSFKLLGKLDIRLIYEILYLLSWNSSSSAPSASKTSWRDGIPSNCLDDLEFTNEIFIVLGLLLTEFFNKFALLTLTWLHVNSSKSNFFSNSLLLASSELFISLIYLFLSPLSSYNFILNFSVKGWFIKVSC